MKAISYYGIQTIRCEDKPVPQCGAGQVLIRIAYAGICGSDLHIYNKGMFIQNIPEIMGHEFSGTVAGTGAGVTSVKVGDKVTANPMVTCGECVACRTGFPGSCSQLGFIGEVRPGAYAQYIVLPGKDVVAAPNHADLKQLALAEPLAVALNICEKAALKETDRILVIGPGPIGLLTILAARAVYGVKDLTVMGRSKARLKLASQLGAKVITGDSSGSPEPEPSDCTGNDRSESGSPDDIYGFYDVVIEAAGNASAFNTAVSRVLPGGRVYVVSIFEDDFIFDINEIVAKQISVTGCNVYSAEHIRQAAELIADGKVDVTPLISCVYKPEECDDAFRALCSRDKKVAKILFEMEEK